jgi:dipeptidyl-peptidase 4
MTRQHFSAARLLAALVFAATAAATVAAQQPAPHAPAALTADDYRRAERFLTANTTPLVLRTGVRPTWLDDGRFWYLVTGADGREAILVDPAKGTKAPCELPACKEAVAPLPPRAPRPEAVGRGGEIGANEIVSPDGARVAFVRDHDMWVRELKTGRETRLTKDGVEHYAYGTNNAGWTRSDRPILVWSPDSTKILTFQHDGRPVGTMALATTTTGHPDHRIWKYPLPGDEHIFTIERVVLEVDTGRVVRFQMPPDPHRGTLCDHIVCRGEWTDVQWSDDGRQVAFVSSSRDHKEAKLRIADAATGAIRDVLEEKVETFYESGNGRANWRVLFGSNEVIWFSQRDDWGHLYLYDLASGKLKHRITSGEGNVTQLLRIDEKARMLYFLGLGLERGRDPYYTHFYRIGMDGKGLTLLTPEDANHDIALAPSGEYFVDSYSTPQTPPVAVLRRADGSMVLELEKADISRLLKTGWQPPISFTVKGRDGKTDLYGLMFRPSNFDESKKYPIVNNIYPGPQSGSVGTRSFAAARGDRGALAELGFIVVSIDGMGTPGRSKSFHETYFGNMGDNTLPDQVTGMEQLAKRHPWIDLERAGIYGHSGGGYATAGAMFRYPDFFKVGVSTAGNHDNRAYEDDWAEKWMGLLVMNPDGTSNYDDQANQTHAHNLKGKLLLAHGTMDANVPPYNTYLVVDALIKANKDFDLIMFPNRGHGFGSEAYMMRRRWDYFVKHLLGAEPPREFEITPPGTGGS